MKPTIGRIVIYREPEGRECPALITALEPFGVALTVFPPYGNPYPVGKIAKWPIEGDPDSGTWRWPDRAASA